MKKLPSVLSASLLLCFASAGAYLVRGRAVDVSGNPNIGVLLKAYLPTDSVSSVIAGATGLEGEYELPLKSPGDYLLEFSGIGLKDSVINVKVLPTDSVVTIPVVTLLDDAERLQEVEVVVSKPLIQSDGSKLTYNMNEDPEAASNNILEMLKKVPMVTVDAQENIKVKGQSNFKIHINGKEDPMLSGDPKNVLKSIPASTIKKIEVITEPGAKYDAEGVGGILNIVTESNTTVSGYLAQISAYGSNSSLGGSAYGRTKINKIVASLSASYRNSDINNDKSRQDITANYPEGSPVAVQESHSKNLPMRDTGGFNGNMNLSWEPDTLNLFTLSAYAGNYGGLNRGEGNVIALGPEGDPVWWYDAESKNRYKGMWLGMMLSMQHNFKREGHNLTFSYQLNYGNNSNSSTKLFENYFNIDRRYDAEKTYSKSTTPRHTAQIDYTLPLLLKGHTLEAGAKAVWSPSTSFKESYEGMSLDNLIPVEGTAVKLRQINDVLAAYVSYDATFGRFSGRAGVRYENTRLGIKYIIGDRPDFSHYLNDVVPNLSVTYRLKDATNFRLAYQMRISRPWVGSLNPYVDDSQPGILSYGNPDLKSSRDNKVSLTFNSWGQKIGGNFSVDYTQDDNNIENYVFSRDGIIHSTYLNIGHRRQWYFSGYINWTIINDLRFSLWAGGGYDDYFADLGYNGKLRNSGWSGSYSVSVNYTTPIKLRISAYAGGSTEEVSLQGKGSAYDYHSLSISRDFLKEDRLNISLSASNFLHPHRNWNNTTDSGGLKFWQTYRFPAWNVSASISYRFGGLKADVKQTVNRVEAATNQEGGQQGRN